MFKIARVPARVSLIPILTHNLALYVKQVIDQNDLILNVVRKNEKELNEIAYDKWPLLEARKRFKRIQINIK